MLQEAKQVCPTTTRRMITEGALLVDVRERGEGERTAFDVPAVVSIPLFELEQRWSELPKDRELVLVCESGDRSLKATYFLQFHGFTRVSNLEGGLLKWMRKDFPVKGERYEAPTAVDGACCDGSAQPETASSGCCGTAIAPSTQAGRC